MQKTQKYLDKKLIAKGSLFAVLACCVMGIPTNAMAQNNTALGTLALANNTTGHNNTAVGWNALRYNTTGFYNSAFGSTALISNVGGNSNSAFGFSALASNTSGGFNSAFGYEALLNNTTGEESSAFGYKALRNSTASRNSAFGYEALWNNTTGENNSAFGHSALSSNTAGYKNAAFGYRALADNLTGDYSSAFGHEALTNNTANGSSAFGYHALYSNTSGTNNIAFGYRALYSNQTGYGNSAVGYNTLQNNTSSNNTAFGFNAMLNNATGTRNAAVGNSSMMGNTTGVDNAAVGSGAMALTSTGDKNAALGAVALYNNVGGSCNVGVGYGAGPTSSYPNLQNTIAIGCNAVVTASNTVRIGNSSMTSIGGYANWSNISDARVKKHVQENVPGIDFIKKLRPVTYSYDVTAYNKLVGIVGDDATLHKTKEEIVYTGFIAQEVEQAADELKYEFSGVDKPSNEHTPYALRYAEFVVPVVKATQEQQTIIEMQQKTIEALEHRLSKLERLLTSSTTGVEPVDNGHNSSFIAYPNPSDGEVRVVLQGAVHLPAELQVYDAMGKLVLSKRVQSGTGEALLNLSGHVSGSYIVTLVQGAQKTSKTVVLSHK